jgi:hypothetical protein
MAAAASFSIAKVASPHPSSLAAVAKLQDFGTADVIYSKLKTSR